MCSRRMPENTGVGTPKKKSVFGFFFSTSLHGLVHGEASQLERAVDDLYVDQEVFFAICHIFFFKKRKI